MIWFDAAFGHRPAGRELNVEPPSYRTLAGRNALSNCFQAVNCQATFIESLRDKLRCDRSIFCFIEAMPQLRRFGARTMAGENVFSYVSCLTAQFRNRNRFVKRSHPGTTERVEPMDRFTSLVEYSSFLIGICSHSQRIRCEKVAFQ